MWHNRSGVTFTPVIMNLLKLTASTDEFHLFYPVLLRYKLEFFPLLKKECERQVLAKNIWEWVTRAWRQNLGFNTNEPLPSVQFLENKAHRIVLSILTSLWWSEETALITFKGKEGTLLAEYYAVIFSSEQSYFSNYFLPFNGLLEYYKILHITLNYKESPFGLLIIQR